MRNILIIIMLLLSSVLMADSYVETNTEPPNFNLNVSVGYKVDFSTLEYLETNFTKTEYKYKEDGNTPDYASSETSMVFNPDTGTAKADVWIYWIFATEDKVDVSLSVTNLISGNGKEIPLLIKVDSGEFLSAGTTIPIFSQDDHSGIFKVGGGTAQIFLETCNMENGFALEKYKTNLTLSIKAGG